MKHLQLRGVRYFFMDRNPEKTEAVLLVHGHPFDHSMWNYQLGALKRFRLILPDLRGYGKTGTDRDRIFIEEHALDLAFLLDELELQSVHFIGLSMGGQIIVEFARLFPQRVRSLIICGSSPSAESEKSRKERLELALRMEASGMEEYTRQDIHRYLHPETVEAKGEAYEHLYRMMCASSLAGAVASHRGRVERRDNFTFLGQLQVPCLVIAGDKDGFAPVEEMDKVARAIPKAKLIVLEKAGHLVNMEQPEAFNEAIVDFLERIR